MNLFFLHMAFRNESCWCRCSSLLEKRRAALHIIHYWQFEVKQSPDKLIMASSALRALNSRTVHVKIYPTARTFAERTEVLRVLEGFGPVDYFKSLKVYIHIQIYCSRFSLTPSSAHCSPRCLCYYFQSSRSCWENYKFESDSIPHCPRTGTSSIRYKSYCNICWTYRWKTHRIKSYGSYRGSR